LKFEEIAVKVLGLLVVELEPVLVVFGPHFLGGVNRGTVLTAGLKLLDGVRGDRESLGPAVGAGRALVEFFLFLHSCFLFVAKYKFFFKKKILGRTFWLSLWYRDLKKITKQTNQKRMLLPLPAASTEPYTSHLMPEISLIRTGVEPQGSCFFHSVYSAFRNFRELSAEEKNMYVKKKRKDLADNISVSTWFQIQNGDVAFLQIIEMMRIMVYLIPSFLTDPKETSVLTSYNIDTQVLEVLFNLLDPTQVDGQMLPDWDVECCKMEKNELSKDILLHRMKSKWHQIYQENIQKAIQKIEEDLDPGVEKMCETKKLAVVHKLSELSYFLFDFVVEKALLNFKEDISNYTTWINTFHYLYLVESMNLDADILFIDASTGLPYEGMRYFPLASTATNYIVLLYFPDYHFESLGERTTLRDRKVINRIFPSDHPFITGFIDYVHHSHKKEKTIQKHAKEYETTGDL